MRTVVKGVSLAAILLLAASVIAQDNKPQAPKPQDNKVKPALNEENPKDEAGVHRMEIYNGPLRTVHYVYRGLSPSEAQAVRELERAENEMTLSDEMLKLRMQYVSGERTFDSQRRFSQEQLFGYTEQQSSNGSFTANRRVGPYGAIYGSGYWGGGWGGWGGWGMGGYGAGSVGVSGGYTSTDSVGLAQGVGDEGRIKTEMARTIAGQATPEYAAKASQDLLAAAARAGNSDTLRAQLGVPKTVTPAAFGSGGPVVITRVLEGKAEKIEGKVLGEEGDWLLLDTKAGKRRLLKSTIVDVLEPNPNE